MSRSSALAAWLLLSPALAVAQPVMTDGAPDEAARRWQRRLARLLPDAPDLEAEVRAREPADTVSPERLAVIEALERALVAAREATARLDEREALILLAEATQLAQGHLDVPGIAAWYAELELAIALTAAQAGLDSLSEAALRRAASVDPSRAVMAAEAAPAWVARADAAARAIATAPRGRFEVRADAAGAVVFLDDRALGPAPRIVEAPIGAHVLRVDAPAHRSWARIIPVFEGDRPAIEVRLSPSPALRAAREASAAARAGRPGAVARALARLEPADTLFMVWPSRRVDRAVVIGCRPGGCTEPVPLAGESLPDRLAPAFDVAAPDLAASLAWLEPDPRERGARAPAWWERWEPWVAIGAAIAAGVTATVVVAQPSGAPPLQIIVDPRDLPTP